MASQKAVAVQKRGGRKKMGMKVKENLYQAALWFILILVALTMILQFLYVVILSFTDATAYEAGKLILWPKKWSTEAYELILSGSGFLNALKSTLIVTFIGTPLSVIVCSGLAYMLSKPIPGKSFINKYVMFTMLFSAGMVPNFINMKQLHLLDSYWALILPGLCGAWTIMVMRSFFQSLPLELEEAAKIDGCGPLKIFSKIVIPLSKPMLATMTLFSFVGYWNTYFNSVMYITSTAKQTLQVYVQKIVLSSTVADVVDLSTELATIVPQEVMRMAAVVVVIIPILIIYPFLQKYFQTGMMVGAVKG